MRVPFNRVYATGSELDYIREAIDETRLSGNGPFANRCSEWLARSIGAPAVLMTNSGTAALEMAVMLAGIEPGDEVVMPSFTFSSTANAVVLRGGVPVFVDIREDTLNLDEALVEEAVTPRTKALFPVHYAGVGCAMDEFGRIAERHGLVVLEDAAQALLASFGSRALGGFGQVAALSFHETKNVTCGEGGALIVNDERLVRRAEIIQEKGTNRREFSRGRVDKYSWLDVGSSYALSELGAAFLWAQLEQAESITAQRLAVWNAYHEALEGLEREGLLRRPIVPDDCRHNGHLYYVLVEEPWRESGILDRLDARGVNAVFHYVPLHAAPAGRRYGRTSGQLSVTESVSERLIRLPLWVGMGDAHVEHVVGVLSDELVAGRGRAARAAP